MFNLSILSDKGTQFAFPPIILILVLILTSCSAADLTPVAIVVSETPLPAVPAPRLLEPADGATFAYPQDVTLQWDWDRPLNQYEFYDVRVWRDGQPAYGISWASVGEFNLDQWLSQQSEGGTFYWQVAVIAGRDGKLEKNVSDASAVYSFTLENTVVPTATLAPTVAPTSTPDMTPTAPYIDNPLETSDELMGFIERQLIANDAAGRVRYAFDEDTSQAELESIGANIHRDFLTWLHAPPRHTNTIDDLSVTTLETYDDYTLKYVAFTNANGLTVRGLVYIPDDGEPHPVMVINFASAEVNSGDSLLDLEEYYPPANNAPARFAGNYLVFALELPNAYKDEMFLFSTAGGFNAQYYSTCDRVSSALDYLETLPEADMSRTGIYGVSNGGLAAISAGVCDERLQAIAASGTNDFTSTLTQITDNRRFIYPSFYYYNVAGRPDYYEAMYSFFPRLVIMELHPLDDTGVYDEALANAERIQAYYGQRGQPDMAHLVILPEDRCADKVRHHCMGVDEVKTIFDNYFQIGETE